VPLSTSNLCVLFAVTPNHPFTDILCSSSTSACSPIYVQYPSVLITRSSLTLLPHSFGHSLTQLRKVLNCVAKISSHTEMSNSRIYSDDVSHAQELPSDLQIDWSDMQIPDYAASCLNCSTRKATCDRGEPCGTCTNTGRTQKGGEWCVYADRMYVGNPKRRSSVD